MRFMIIVKATRNSEADMKSKAEAIEWVKKAPHPHPGVDTNIEIRQLFEDEDFQ